jgi:hypothetical protein
VSVPSCDEGGEAPCFAHLLDEAEPAADEPDEPAEADTALPDTAETETA